jgi:uncharacterized protein YcbK (DUF882 family)
LHPGFAERLDNLREALGRPMVLTSACRSEAHNRRVGGAASSLHICDAPARPGQKGTLAVDVRVRDRQEAATLVRTALNLGWSVGVPPDGKGFIHCDARDLLNLPQVVFGY